MNYDIYICIYYSYYIYNIVYDLSRYFHLFILMHIFRVNRADTVRWSMSQMDTGG